MPRLSPVKVGLLIKVFEADGWEQVRRKGSHLSMTKAGYERPVVIVIGKKEVKPSHIQTNLTTAGISRERYFELLKEVS